MEKMKNNTNIFSQDINDFKKNNTYPIEAIRLVEDHQDQLIDIFNYWENAFDKVASAFNISDSDRKNIPYKLHQLTFEKIKKDFK